MSKQINFSWKDQDYTLEFTKRTISIMEKNGFDVNELSNKPMTMLPMLFSGAFLCHHNRVAQETIDEIYKNIPNKEELIKTLSEMYVEPITALFDEPDNVGNLNWVVKQ